MKRRWRKAVAMVYYTKGAQHDCGDVSLVLYTLELYDHGVQLCPSADASRYALLGAENWNRVPGQAVT